MGTGKTILGAAHVRPFAIVPLQERTAVKVG